MPNTFVRCHYINETDQQCNSWFDSDVNPEQKFCPSHADCISIDKAMKADDNAEKKRYIDRCNEVNQLCIAMSNEELERHIASIEARIESLRTDLMASRAHRAARIEKMTEDERKLLRSQKINIAMETKEPKKVKEPKVNTSIKADPILHFMKKFGVTQEQAKAMMADLL